MMWIEWSFVPEISNFIVLDKIWSLKGSKNDVGDWKQEINIFGETKEGGYTDFKKKKLKEGEQVFLL